MKLSLCRMIAICCMLAVGFLTVTLFVQTTDAHGPAHFYNTEVIEYKDVWCAGCGVYMGITVVNRFPVSVGHDDNLPHIGPLMYKVGNAQSLCFACLLEGT